MTYIAIALGRGTRASKNRPADTDTDVVPGPSAAQFRGLADVARVATTGTRDDLLRRVAMAAQTALDGASVSLSVWDAASRQFRCILNAGQLGPGETPEPVDEVYDIADYENLMPLVEEQRGITCSVNQPDQDNAYVVFLRRLGKASCIAAPIPLDGRVWGELFVTRRHDQPAFVAEDVDFAVAVAAQVGAAIATSEIVERAEALAHTDSLTGLANRRAIDEWFDVAMADHVITRHPVGLIVCDVNGLKKINDQSGHEAGDRVLRQLAQVLHDRAATLLPQAVVGRLGGDEFAVAVKGVEPDALVAFAEDLTANAWRLLPFGVACGVVSTGDAVGSIDSAGRLFRLADAAQYRAKRTGSQRPVVAGRVLPLEASTQVVSMKEGAADRRLLRGHQSRGALQLLDAALRALDEAASESTPARLGLVADLLSHYLDAVGWWLSSVYPGTNEVETREYAIYRALPGLTPEELANEVGSRFAIGAYPATGAALRGGSFAVRADDPDADPGELAILDDLAAVAVVGAGGEDQEGTQWLVEVYTDALSGSERDLVTLLRVLVVAALNPPRPE